MNFTEYIDGCPDYFERSIVPTNGKKPIVSDYPSGVDTKLLETMRYNSISLVCGLEPSYFYCIDVDEKYYNGIAERVWSEWASTKWVNDSRIVVESTASGGAHYWFRTDGVVGGSRKLCSRLITTNEKGKDETVCYIETRGAGSVFRTYPSDGCELITDWMYPEGILSLEEFEELIKFFSKYNEYVKPPQFVSYTPKKVSDKYNKDPFADYRDKVSCYDILTEAGWTIHTKQGSKLHMIKPGATRKSGVHGTYHEDSNSFYVYTTNCELESNETYNSVDLAIHYKYGGSSQMYEGIKGEYGVLNNYESSRMVERWLYDSINKYSNEGVMPELPAIINEEHKIKAVDRINVAVSEYEHGIFWDLKNNGNGLEIDRERLYNTCNKMGIRRYNGLPVLIVDNPHCIVEGRRFITSLHLFEVNKYLKGYVRKGIKFIGEDDDTTILNALDSFMENHDKHLLLQIEEVRREDFLGDDEKTFRRFFKNCWVEVTANGVSYYGYDDIPDGLIPIDKFINFEYRSGIEPKNGSLFVDFLKNATVNPSYTLLCLAHLIHDYKTPALPYMIGMVEGTDETSSIGGSGKNLLVGLVSKLTGCHHISAESVKTDSSMLQSWRNERLVSLDDLPKSFDFTSLRELVTGSALIKNLYKDIRDCDFYTLPKFTFNSNYGVPLLRGDIRRRVRVIEFTEFFNKTGGVAMHYASVNEGLPIDYMFPNGKSLSLNAELKPNASHRHCWDDGEYVAFFNIMFQSVSVYIKGGMMLPEEEMTENGWNKNFTHTHGDGELAYMETNFELLIGKSMSNVDVYNHYIAFCSEAGIPPIYRKSSKAHTAALRDWAKTHGVDIQENVSVGLGVRGKRFERARVMHKGVKMPLINNVGIKDDGDNEQDDKGEEMYEGGLPF